MGGRPGRFWNSVAYTLTSSVFSAFVSVLSVLVIPKVVGVVEYGYWALFVFYTSYVPFALAGWADGIYLRLGGTDYRDLDRGLLSLQSRLIAISQLVVAGALAGWAAILVEDGERQFVLISAAIYLVIVNIRYFYTYILQASLRFSSFAQIILLDRGLYLAIVALLLALGTTDYRSLVVADLSAKAVSLGAALFMCRDVVASNPAQLKRGLEDVALNISAGVKLTISNTSNMLILGVVRFAIDRSFGVAAFGKMSLALNLSSFVMVLVNSVGIVIFPYLRRIDNRRLGEFYENIRSALMPVLLGLLLLYQPIAIAMAAWLPDFQQSIRYLALLFPIVAFEGKMALLVNTYFKALRKEGKLLSINLLALVLSAILAYLSTVTLRSLDLAALSIAIVLGIRGVAAELAITQQIGVTVLLRNIFETALCGIFVLATWHLEGWTPSMIYALCFMVYIVAFRGTTVAVIRQILRRYRKK